MIRLATSVGTFHLVNPVICGAGEPVMTEAGIRAALHAGAAGVIAKSVNENYITLEVIFCGLIAAIAWNLLTWWFGIPSSSSHTLLGGFMGAAIAHAGSLKENGISVINYAKVIPTFLFIFLLTYLLK